MSYHSRGDNGYCSCQWEIDQSLRPFSTDPHSILSTTFSQSQKWTWQFLTIVLDGLLLHSFIDKLFKQGDGTPITRWFLCNLWGKFRLKIPEARSRIPLVEQCNNEWFLRTLSNGNWYSCRIWRCSEKWSIIIIALLIQEATLKNLTGLWWANIYRLGLFPLLKIWNMLSWTMMKWKGKMKTLF